MDLVSTGRSSLGPLALHLNRPESHSLGQAQSDLQRQQIMNPAMAPQEEAMPAWR